MNLLFSDKLEARLSLVRHKSSWAWRKGEAKSAVSLGIDYGYPWQATQTLSEVVSCALEVAAEYRCFAQGNQIE